MLEELKGLNDLGEAIKKASKEVGPDAIKHVGAIRLKNIIVSGVAVAISIITILICLPWGINLLTQNDSSPLGIILTVLSAAAAILSICLVGCALDEIGTLIVHRCNPKADTVDYWTDKFKE